jgi:hypothetical protein
MSKRWVLGLVLLFATASAMDLVRVRREGVRVMKAPRFFGAPCDVSVSAGARVAIVERRGAWARIEAPGDGQCWVHETAWADRTAGELAGDAARASQRDVELAARGFTEEEYAHYAAEHPDLGAGFDVVESYLGSGAETSGAQLVAFLEEGRLGGTP